MTWRAISARPHLAAAARRQGAGVNNRRGIADLLSGRAVQVVDPRWTALLSFVSDSD